MNITDGPWASWFEDDLHHQRLKSAGAKLARLLKRYKIKPRKIRIGKESVQGYAEIDFMAIGGAISLPFRNSEQTEHRLILRDKIMFRLCFLRVRTKSMSATRDMF